MHRLYRKNNQKVVSWMLVLIMCLSFGLMPAFAESANAEDANAEGSILEEGSGDETTGLLSEETGLTGDGEGRPVLSAEGSEGALLSDVGMPLGDSGGSVDVTGLLTDLIVKVKQGDKEIGDDDKLNPTDPVDVEISFGVPVIGDGGAEGSFVHWGDTASIELAKGFKVLSASPMDLVFKYVEDGKEISKKVGTITLETTGSGESAETVAKIVFDGDIDIFDGTEDWSKVKCEFNATLQYDGSGSGDEDKDYDVYILEKKFTVHVPAKAIELTGEKSGVREDRFIDWTVKVNAKQGENPVSLAGYIFSDDLTDVGVYVADSFMIGTKDEGSALAKPDPSADYDPDTKVLTYTFPADTTADSGVIIQFRTEIPNGKYYGNGTQTITNTAEVWKENTVEWSDDGTVEFDAKWIEKDGAKTTFDAASNTGTITWTITANSLGATLPNAIITDVLDENLNWESATLQIWDENIGDKGGWGASTEFKKLGEDTPKAMDYNPATGKYYIGTIDSPVLLTIVTKVKITDEFNIGHKVQHIENSATIEWDGHDGIGSGSKGVDIGINPIQKTVGSYNVSTHTIPWTVTVVKSDINIDLRVLDLLVYGPSGFSASDIDGISTGSGGIVPLEDVSDEGGLLTQVSKADIGKLKPQYNQKYKPGSFEPAESPDLKATVYTLYHGGQAVADLLVVTKGDGSGIEVLSGEKTFSFETIVTNPDVYAKNGDTDIWNTASLFSANKELNNATAKTTYQSKMLVKDMLSVGDAKDPDENKNNGGASTNTGYDYIDHSVVFRLHVNANDLKDFTKDVTTIDGQTVGKVTLTDTLPEGWVFKKFDGDKDFLIYKGTPGTGGKVTAVGNAIDPSSFLEAAFTSYDPDDPSDPGNPNMATFTFTTLDQPYVILLKAGPSEGTIDGFFKQNNNETFKNNATLFAENWESGVKSWQDVKVESKILAKGLDFSKAAKDGVLTWTVEYKPNEIGHKEAYIEDTLPAGIDLRTDATGRLILDDNITVTELTLNANGNYTDGDPMKSEDLEKAISYDHGTRVLRFDIPESSKAYRLTYKTDITGDPGTTLANKVALSSSTTTQGGVEKGYTIADADASATMQRSGSLEIKKQDGSKEPEPLEDAEFTLYTEDGKTEFRKGKTGEDGILTLRGLPEGSYILKETKAPDGYNLVDRTYEVVVVKMANGKLSTSIDGKTEPDSNKITVTNIKTDTVGNLAIRKTLSGNATDTKKEFTFTVTIFTVDGEEIYGLSEEEFAYIGTGGKADGTLALDEDGKATFTLKGGESITILNLPKDFSYTVVEEDYRGDGYTTTFTNADGTIEADKVTEVIFTNTRNRPDTPDPEPTPKPTPKPTPTPKPMETPEPSESPKPTETPEPTPDVTIETTPEPTETPKPVTPTDPPQYRPEEVPDPNDPESPDHIVIIDENDVPYGHYYKHKKPDGSFVYLDERGIPFGYKPVPRTGDDTPVVLWLAILLGSLSAAAVLVVLRKKQSRQRN